MARVIHQSLYWIGVVCLLPILLSGFVMSLIGQIGELFFTICLKYDQLFYPRVDPYHEDH